MLLQRNTNLLTLQGFKIDPPMAASAAKRFFTRYHDSGKLAFNHGLILLQEVLRYALDNSRVAHEIVKKPVVIGFVVEAPRQEFEFI